MDANDRLISSLREAGLLVEAPDPPPANFEGLWRMLLLEPAVVSAQSFVVGIVVADNKGKIVAHRLLEDFTRFDAIFGEGSAGRLAPGMQSVRRVLGSPDRDTLWSNEFEGLPGYSVSDQPLYCSGHDGAQGIANLVYEIQVVMDPAWRTG